MKSSPFNLSSCSRLFSSSGQHILEYILVIILVVAAMITMGPYVIRAWNANLKGWEDSAQDSMNDPLLQVPDQILLPYCECGEWAPTVCGGGHCSGTERQYTRTCNPAGCSHFEKCEVDDSCCVYSDPLECGVNATPPCPDGERRMTEECGDNGPRSVCVADASCVFICLNPFSGNEYGNECSNDDTGLSSSMPWVAVESGVPGGCDDSRKCQHQCAEGFVPDPGGGACICPEGQIRMPNGECCDPPNNETRVYSGTVADCNAAVVTTNPSHLNCATGAIGYLCEEGTVPLYSGTVANCNAAVVTTNPNHLNCATQFIGYACDHASGTSLYSGTVANCNAGVVTTNPTHLNCATRFIGYTSDGTCEESEPLPPCPDRFFSGRENMWQPLVNSNPSMCVYAEWNNGDYNCSRAPSNSPTITTCIYCNASGLEGQECGSELFD